MKGDLRCVEGQLYRHDPQPDDPNLETDRGVCPDCNGRGCEPPKAQHTSRQASPDAAVLVSFDKRLTDDELRDFEAYCREWVQ